MKRQTLPNATLVALIASCFTQVGAQLFAIVVVVRTLVAAPPRSFAILQGEHAYDSSSFWSVVPMVTLVLFIAAVVANWRTTRRMLLVVALVLFLGGGALAGMVIEPQFAELTAIGYRDVVDPALQERAARWYTQDLALWGIVLAAGITLLLALARPVQND